MVIPDDEGIVCRTLYCNHHDLLTDYILFDVLLLAVYLYGVYLFRSEDGGDLSYLHNLASRVSDGEGQGVWHHGGQGGSGGMNSGTMGGQGGQGGSGGLYSDIMGGKEGQEFCVLALWVS